jgi:hypothetical protein
VWRVTVAGLGGRGKAADLCAALKARGQACFAYAPAGGAKLAAR